jgi:hypothetical protein
VEEERLRLGDGQPGRRQLTLGRTVGEAPRAEGWRQARDGQQRDARVRFKMDWGEQWRASLFRFWYPKHWLLHFYLNIGLYQNSIIIVSNLFVSYWHNLTPN